MSDSVIGGCTISKTAQDLEDRLVEWQTYYNWFHPHTSLNGKTPMDRFFEKIRETLFSSEVAELYDEADQPRRVR